MTAPGRLEVSTVTGRVTGPASITYNDPWPCANGSWGSGTMQGLVLHTMVGNLPGTIEWFNNPQSQASAWFGVDQQGGIHQFGPLGRGWVAWAQAAGNHAWYSVEMADDGNPASPLTPAQVTAGAQLLEVLSRFAGFPLQVTDNPVSGTGLITHGDGGVPWGDHPDCPGDVRKAQRAQIVALAMAIRGTPAAPAPAAPAPAAPAGVTELASDGRLSLAELAAARKTWVSTIIRLTAEHSPDSVFDAAMAAYLNAVFAGSIDPGRPLPAGLTLYVP
jgi:hypothetical protein